MTKLGETLKKLRGDESIRSAAENIGISHAYLSTLEKGYDPRTKKERKPTPEILKKIASYYDVPYFTLLYISGLVDDIPYEEMFRWAYEEGGINKKEYEFSKHLSNELHNISKHAPNMINIEDIYDYILVGTPVFTKKRKLNYTESLLMANVINVLLGIFHNSEQPLNDDEADNL